MFLFEKAEISLAGSLDFKSSLGANDLSVMSLLLMLVFKLCDEYIDSFLCCVCKFCIVEVKIDDVLSMFDDVENDSSSFRFEDVFFIFESDFVILLMVLCCLKILMVLFCY